MSAWVLFAAGTAAAFAVMALLYLLSRKLKNAAIIDPVWAAIIGVLALTYAVLADGDPARRLTAGLMGGVWGARLSFYILLRKVIGKPEDPRYAELRRGWGERAERRMFEFYMLQAGAAAFFALPFLLAASNLAPGLNWLEKAAVLLWIVAFNGEAAADMQLDRFKSNPGNRGRICQDGLWNYSRHPNYFFEWLVWVSVFLFCVSSPWGWLTILCPAFMYHILIHVTGIPKAEEQALRTKGEAYREYMRTTSSFIPWFKKKGGS